MILENALLHHWTIQAQARQTNDPWPKWFQKNSHHLIRRPTLLHRLERNLLEIWLSTKVRKRIYLYFVPLVSKHLAWVHADIPLWLCSIIEYTTMLLDAILQMHAWASGRFKYKTQLEGQKLENQNLRIIKTEAEQGMYSPTPSSSTSAFSFLSSVSKFRYRAIGIVGMLRLPSKSYLESAMCYLLFIFWNWLFHCILWFCQVCTAWSMLTIDYSCDIREGTRGPCRLCDNDEEGSGCAYWIWLGGLISDVHPSY